MTTYIIIFVTAAVSLACFNSRKLFDGLAMWPYRVAKNKEWYRLITHGFVHADFIHLLINMLVFFSFGIAVESLFGKYSQAKVIGNPDVAFLFLYFGGMVLASLPDIVKRRNNPTYRSIGASGAVSAVVFTSIFFNPWGLIYFFAIIPIPGILFGIFFLLYSQYMVKHGGGNINHNAHFYGAVYGLVFPLLLNPQLANVFIKNLMMIR